MGTFCTWHIPRTCLIAVKNKAGELHSPVYHVLDHVFDIQLCLVLGHAPNRQQLLFAPNGEPMHIFAKVIGAQTDVRIRSRFRFTVRQMRNDSNNDHRQPFPTCPTYVGEAKHFETEPRISGLVQTLDTIELSELTFEEGQQAFCFLFKEHQTETPRYPFIYRSSIYAKDDELQIRFTNHVTIDCEMMFTVRAKCARMTMDMPALTTDAPPLIGDTNCDTTIRLHDDYGRLHTIQVHQHMLPPKLRELLILDKDDIIELFDWPLAELMAVLRFAYYKMVPAMSDDMDGILAKSADSGLKELTQFCNNAIVIGKCFETMHDVNKLVFNRDEYHLGTAADNLPGNFCTSKWVQFIRNKADKDHKKTIEQQSMAMLKAYYTRNTLPDLENVRHVATADGFMMAQTSSDLVSDHSSGSEFGAKGADKVDSDDESTDLESPDISVSASEVNEYYQNRTGSSHPDKEIEYQPIETDDGADGPSVEPDRPTTTLDIVALPVPDSGATHSLHGMSVDSVDDELDDLEMDEVRWDAGKKYGRVVRSVVDGPREDQVPLLLDTFDDDEEEESDGEPTAQHSM